MDRAPWKLGIPVRSSDTLALGLITVVWVAMVITVNPIGDFPLNDDWAYGWSVKTLLEKGEFQLSDWTAVNLFSQVFWGALFCLPFGFSFTALRLSTLTLGLIGVISTYGVLREVKASPGFSLAGAVTVALNPLYFCLSNSFMTDVPAFSFTTVAFYFLIRALNRQSAASLVVGLTVSLMAILSRQTGVIIMPAFSVAYLMKNGVGRRSLFRALCLNLAGLAVYLIYPRWLEVSGRTPYLYDFQTTMLFSSFSASPLSIAATYAQNLFVMSTYLGLFLLPFLLVAGQVFSTKNITRPATLAAIVLVMALGLWAARYKSMPSVGNLLDVAGMGPSSISGARRADLDPLTLRRIWQVATVMGVIGGALLLRVLVRATRAAFTTRTDVGSRAFCSFALAMTGLFVLPIAALRGHWFDRYLIALFPALMVLTSLAEGAKSSKVRVGWGLSICVLLLTVYGLFTVTATHDYLAWNRHRWALANVLLRERHIPAAHVQAGMEFKGWFFAQRLRDCDGTYQQDPKRRSWSDFPCLSSRPETPYRVAAGRRKGYTIEERRTFRRWLPLRDQEVYLLRHDAP